MLETIQNIHNSDLFGIFIEMGLGNPVTSKLCEIPGASKTVFYAENPYNDKLSRQLYGIEGRIVSLEAVKQILNSIRIASIKSLDKDNKVNTVFVSSFQIGNYNDKSTHGYIGIRKNNVTRYYHISIHDSLNRYEYIDLIAKDSMFILDKKINSIFYCDGTWNEDLEPLYEETFDFISEYPNFAYIENGKILRLEDLTRKASKGLIVYKGSFNPITKAHCKLMSESEKLYPDYKSCYSISLNTWGKESDVNNVIERIKLINKLGYGVLIYGNPLFDDFHADIMKKYDKTIVYPMGADTVNRYIKDEPDFSLSNRRFIISSRKGSTFDCNYEMNKISDFIEINEDVSSSNIRNSIKTNNQEYIDCYIPVKLINELDEFKKTI